MTEQQEETPEETPEDPLDRLPIQQGSWRKAGALALGCAALMAWYGADEFIVGKSTLALLAYWSVFTLLLCVTTYCVILDIRYIKTTFVVGQRDAFMNTLGSKEFREALQKQLEEKEKEKEDKK
jgi:hypothetical protein